MCEGVCRALSRVCVICVWVRVCGCGCVGVMQCDVVMCTCGSGGGKLTGIVERCIDLTLCLSSFLSSFLSFFLRYCIPLSVLKPTVLGRSGRSDVRLDSANRPGTIGKRHAKL